MSKTNGSIINQYQYEILQEKFAVDQLKDLVARSIVDADVLRMQQQKMDEKIIEAVKSIHKAKIAYRAESQGKGRPQRWHYVTQFVDPITGKYVKVKGDSEDEVWEKLSKKYNLDPDNPVEQTSPAVKSLASLFPDWIEYRSRFVDGQTVKKDLWVWDRYYKDDPITFKSIPRLSLADIKTWLSEQITKHNLTRRQFREMKGVWNSLEQYGMEAGIIDPSESKIRHARNFKGFAPDIKKTDEEQIYTKEEKETLIAAAMQHYHQHDNSSYLAVILSFFFGIRVGEMVCLRFSDFDWDAEKLTVQRMERQGVSVDGTTTSRNGYQVVDHLKANWECRTLSIPTGARVVVDFIHAEQKKHGITSDWLFVRGDGSRRHKEDIDKALHRICKSAGIPDKTGLHQSRRTYCSDLIASGCFSEREVMNKMGHKDFRTTQGYYDRAKKQKDVTDAAAVTQAIGVPLPVIWSNVG